MKKHEIKTVDIDLLYPNSYNSNKMPEAKFEALVDTVRRTGQTHPVQVVDDGKGKFRIVGGEHRWRAMKLLKYKDVEIIIRKFEDEIEEKLSSIEDNLHGNPIPIKEALIIHSATKKYSLAKLKTRLGEDESELKDKLILVTDEQKLKKLEEDINQEHTVELDFIVDSEPKGNAERLIKELTSFANQIGAKLMKAETKLSKTKETIALLNFNVSEMQLNVINRAINMISRDENVTKSRALELMSADYLAGAKTSVIPTPKRKKLSTRK